MNGTLRHPRAMTGMVLALAVALLVNTLLMLFVHRLTAAPVSRPSVLGPALRAGVLPPEHRLAPELTQALPPMPEAVARPPVPQLEARKTTRDDRSGGAAGGSTFAAPRIELPGVPTGGAYLGDMMQGDSQRLVAPPESRSKDGEQWAAPNARFGEPGGNRSGASGPAAMLPGISTDLVPLHRIEPIYPKQALTRGLEGSVVLEFTIGGDGRVSDIALVSASSGLFEAPSRSALAKWIFQPEMRDGRPVARRARQTFSFSLDD